MTTSEYLICRKYAYVPASTYVQLYTIGICFFLHLMCDMQHIFVSKKLKRKEKLTVYSMLNEIYVYVNY